jgi:hypothetical protein
MIHYALRGKKRNFPEVSGHSADKTTIRVPYKFSKHNLVVPKNGSVYVQAAGHALTNQTESQLETPRWLQDLLDFISVESRSRLASISIRYSEAVDSLNKGADALSSETRLLKWGESGPPAIDSARVSGVRQILPSTPSTLTMTALKCRINVLELLAGENVAFSEFELRHWFDPEALLVVHGFPVNRTGGDGITLPLLSNTSADFAFSMKPGTFLMRQISKLGLKVVRVDILHKVLPWNQCKEGFIEWGKEIAEMAALIVGCEFKIIFSHGQLANDAIRNAAINKFKMVDPSIFGIGERRSMVEIDGGRQIHMLQHPQMQLPSFSSLPVAQQVARRSDDLLLLLAEVISMPIPINFGSCEGLTAILDVTGWQGTFTLLDLVKALRTEELLSHRAIPWEELPTSVQEKAMEAPAYVQSQEEANNFIARTTKARDRELPSGVLAALSNLGFKGGKCNCCPPSPVSHEMWIAGNNELTDHGDTVCS